VKYNYKVTNSIQGIYFRTFAPDRTLVAKEPAMHQFLKDKPTSVYFTITYTDEYNDEWTTAVTTIDYTSFCLAATTPATGGICLSTPTTGFKSKSTGETNQMQPTRETLQRLSEHVNDTLLALPTKAIPKSYVWSAANPLDVVCADHDKSTLDNDLRGDVKLCLKDPKMYLKGRTFQQYPWTDGTGKSKYVNSLDFRLDLKITGNVDFTNKQINFDGTDTEVFGLALFVKLPGPGVNAPLQVRYWYQPESKLGDKDVRYTHIDGTSNPGEFTDSLFLKQDLVVIQNLVASREWNADDGDNKMEFSPDKVSALPYCSDRGICDFESGICNCFSGYTGLRCDTQNAVTYSY